MAYFVVWLFIEFQSNQTTVNEEILLFFILWFLTFQASNITIREWKRLEWYGIFKRTNTVAWIKLIQQVWYCHPRKKEATTFVFQTSSGLYHKVGTTLLFFNCLLRQETWAFESSYWRFFIQYRVFCQDEIPHSSKLRQSPIVCTVLFSDLSLFEKKNELVCRGSRICGDYLDVSRIIFPVLLTNRPEAINSVVILCSTAELIRFILIQVPAWGNWCFILRIFY